MSNIQHINPHGIKDPSDYGFTQAVVVPSGSKLVYIAGQGGADENGNYGSFSEQIERAFASLHKVLTAVGATPEDVVKITILSVEHNEEKLGIISAWRKSTLRLALAPFGDAGFLSLLVAAQASKYFNPRTQTG